MKKILFIIPVIIFSIIFIQLISASNASLNNNLEIILKEKIKIINTLITQKIDINQEIDKTQQLTLNVINGNFIKQIINKFKGVNDNAFIIENY